MKKIKEIKKEIQGFKALSYWKKGVKLYALDFLDFLEENNYQDFENPKNLENCLLNGAENWQQFSEGGSSLIYNHDICKRLVNKTEQKKTKNGKKNPNSDETWLDIQARALHQAFLLLKHAIKK